MLIDYSILFSYILLVSFHNVMFVAMVICIIRIFVLRYAPYSNLYVGSYAMIHSIYRGCPVIVYENTLSQMVNNMFGTALAYKDPSDTYILFGDLGWVMQIIVGSAGLMMVISAYKTWHNAKYSVNWSNIFGELNYRRVWFNGRTRPSQG